MASLAPRPTLADVRPSTELLRRDLRNAVRSNLDRCLPASSKFAAELLAALPPPIRRRSAPAASTSSSRAGAAPPHPHPTARSPHVHFRTSTPVKTPLSSTSRLDPRELGGPAAVSGSRGGQALPSVERHGGRDSLGSVLSMGEASSPVVERSAIMSEEDRMDASGEDLRTEVDPRVREEWTLRDEDEQDLYALAVAYVQNHELLRAAHVLKECTGPKARWLRGYARFLAGEKRTQEEAGELLGVKDRPRPNPFTQELLDEMATWEEGFVNSDGHLLYLKSLLLLSLPPIPPAFIPPHSQSSTATSAPSSPTSDLRLAALETLVNSVKLEPYNWSAWKKIAECLDGPEELEATLPFLPLTIPLLFFYIHCTFEIHAASDGLHDVIDELEGLFEPESGVVRGLRASVYYHLREFEDATTLFTALHTSDPYRIEDLDVFSNILYVSERRAELAALAQEYVKIDRMRPEVCCLVGNYYSLRREHEKAILYFRRALKLDRNYLSAWTLMGHEYVEIKNTNAAIASYRRAVEVDRKDYRAWYGLGQAYELLGEPYYALNYYNRATALRPYDARMWSALATCHEKLKRIPDAIRAHQRALLASEPGDGSDISLRIGKLYAALGQGEPAAAYHRRALSDGLQAGLTTIELGRVYIWLAKWEMRRSGLQAGTGTGARGTIGDLGKAEEYLHTLEATQEFRDEAMALLKDLEVLLLMRE
ncbi:cell division control protein 23 [Rhodotorula toruloides]|uniref:Cell division control protein 23 n=1 Tax=Rhodotorula toruloides TaxID=5286 RepID=A0A511KS32_RHOTO|nr:cell division control protein 23 [Rhodotorula toruloides]